MESTPNTVSGSFAEAVKKAEGLLPGMLTRFTTWASNELAEQIRDVTPPYEGRIPGSPDEPYSTGRLKASITPMRTVRTGNVYSGGAYTKVPYASHVEYDTHAHIIMAKNAPYLYFFWFKKGRIFMGHYVKHPGTRGQHMFARGAAALESMIDNKLEQYIKEWKNESGL
jgi:hypothetical protein